MAGALAYWTISGTSLILLGIHHMAGATRAHQKSPQAYSAKPFHPVGRFRQAQLYALITGLAASSAHHAVSSEESLSSLHSAALCLLFLLLASSLLLSDSFPTLLPFPHSLAFSIAAAFFLLSTTTAASARGGSSSLEVEEKCQVIAGRVSWLAGAMSLAVAVKPRLFPAELGLGGAVLLKGLWAVQTGLSLNVEAFIPEGCHRLLDVPGSTKCDLDQSAARAGSVLELAFLGHVGVAFVATMLVLLLLHRTRSSSSYDPLPTTHIQMKAISGTQA